MKLFLFSYSFPPEIRSFQFGRLAGLTGALLLISIYLNAQQCTLPSRMFIPTADQVPFEQLSDAIDVDGEYMVAGASENCDLQVYSGRAIVYKLGTDNRWAKIAELTPSDPGKYRKFGTLVSIQGNAIVIGASEYNDAGIGRGKLYVFQKTDGEEWVSATEDYVITKPFGAILGQRGFGVFDLRDNQLVAIATEGSRSFIEVYFKVGSTFSLVQTIPVPLSNTGYDVYGWGLALGNDFIAISSEEIENPDNSNGAVFVYQRAGIYNTTPSILKSASQTATTYEGFGGAVAATNNTLFVQGRTRAGDSYDQTFYVFEKPPGGWVNASQPIMLRSPGYNYSNQQLVANDLFIFSTGPGYNSIVGFKRPIGPWTSSAARFEIDGAEFASSSVFGWRLAMNDKHLVVGCANRFLLTGTPKEVIADYYSPNGQWDPPALITHQRIEESSVSAADDFFGQAFSVYNDQIAISASGDDEGGYNTGAVYIFDAQGQSNEPDQKIFNHEVENYTGFGQSIAMGDSIMFIGAPYKDSVDVDGRVVYYSIGKVYIYRLTSNGWSYSSQIIAPNTKSDLSFGRQVVWSPGYCAVTEFSGGSSESIGHVHIYKENPSNGKFQYIATLDPKVHLRSDFFGQHMLMNDSLMVIGTGNFAPNASYRNSAYVFRKKGEWKNATEDARLYATDLGWSDRFGASVSMYGKYIVVGAPYSPGFENRPIPRAWMITGAAYIFKQPPGGWKGELTELAKLLPSDPTDFGTFGATVAIDHDDIFIGSPNEYDWYNSSDRLTNNDNTLLPGKVYHYKKPLGDWVSTNQEDRQMQSFEPEIVDGYGASMYVSDRYLYVGAWFDDTESGFRTGSVQTMMQTPVIEQPSTVCVDQTNVKLRGFPRNGTWSGPGVHPTTGIFQPSVAGPGIHTITYERSGCTTSTQIEVLDDVFTILSQSDALQTKCIGKSVPITFDSDEEPENYMWYFKETADGEFSKIDSVKESIVTNKPGFYEVTVTRDICPMHTQPFTVLDEDPIEISIDPVPSICDDNEVQLEVTPTSGQWSGTGVSPGGIFNPAGLQDGSYQELYKVITPVGCIWKDSVVVAVDKLMQPSILYDGAQICGEHPVVLSLTNTDDRSDIVWYGPNGSEIPNQSDVTLKLDEPGTYFASVFKNSCSLTTSSVWVPAVADSLFVPNVFTANGDSYNEYFQVYSEGISTFHLSVFNRYGKMVFETDSPAFNWPATEAPPGTYFWSVSYTTCWKEEKREKGWVQVMK